MQAPPVRLKIEVGEETEQMEETNLPPMEIHSKEDLARLWMRLDEPSQIALIYGPFDWAPRLHFFTRVNLTEEQFSTWLREAFAAGLVKLPPKPKEDVPQAA
jgi:hypothetical protein